MENIIGLKTLISIGILTSILALLLLFYTIQKKKAAYNKFCRCFNSYWSLKEYIDKYKNDEEVFKHLYKLLCKDREELFKLMTIKFDYDIWPIGIKHWELMTKYMKIFLVDESIDALENFNKECELILISYNEYKKNIFSMSIKEVLTELFEKIILLIFIIQTVSLLISKFLHI